MGRGLLLAVPGPLGKLFPAPPGVAGLMVQQEGCLKSQGPLAEEAPTPAFFVGKGRRDLI